MSGPKSPLVSSTPNDDTYVRPELQLLEDDDFPRESAVQFHEVIRDDGFILEWPHVGVAGAPDDPALAVAVADALKTVEAPSDGLDCCPICLHDDDDNGAWKETPCGHRFHGRCVERWLQDKGTCPMCRRQVVMKPTIPDTSSVASLRSALADIFEAYGQDVVTELEQQLPL